MDGCGLDHVDLCSKQQGELLCGIFGPGNGAKKGRGPRDIALRINTQKSRTLKHGKGAGKSCSVATDSDIADCVSKTPLPITTTPGGYRPVDGKGGAFNKLPNTCKGCSIRLLS